MRSRKWMLTLALLVVLVVTATLVLTTRSTQATASLEGMQVTVTKSPLCGCCEDYIAILRGRGVDVEVIDTEDIAGAKLALGVPPSAWSCHTTQVAGYAVEGHVPLEAVERLLSERPEVDGIALPGMPAGSPGMNGTKTAPFRVVAFDASGVRSFGDY